MFNVFLRALGYQWAGDGADALWRPTTPAAVWEALCQLSGEALPADVRAALAPTVVPGAATGRPASREGE